MSTASTHSPQGTTQTWEALDALGISCNAEPYARLEAIETRLYAELTSEQRILVDGLREAEREAVEDWHARIGEALAAHFPGFAPAIRAVAQHLQESDAGAQKDCRLGRAVALGVIWKGCADPVYAHVGDPLETPLGGGGPTPAA